MRITSATSQAVFNRSIGENQNTRCPRTQKHTQQRRSQPSRNIANTRHTTNNRKRNATHPVVISLTVISCLALVSNLYGATRVSIRRNEANNVVAHSCRLLFPPPQMSHAPIKSRQRPNEHDSLACLTSVNCIISTVTDVLKSLDAPLFPAAFAHVIPRRNATQPSTQEADVVIRQIDSRCIKERETLSLSKHLRQIGKTLESPISSLAKELQVIHHVMDKNTGCPTPKEVDALMAAGKRVDNIVSNIVNAIPYGNYMSALQNIGGPLLQMLADTWEGIPIDNNQLIDVDEQAIFLQKSILDFSPRNKMGEVEPEKLTIPKKIILKDKKILTQIEGKTWQLSYDEGRYFASGDTERRGVTYAVAEGEWRFLQDASAADADTSSLDRTISSAQSRPQQTNIHHGPIKVRVVEPELLAREEAKHVGAEAQQAEPSENIKKKIAETLPRKQTDTKKIVKPIYNVAQQKNKGRRPPRARITKKQLRDIHSLGNAGINAAGGLQSLAQQKNIPFVLLQHYIYASGKLTSLGRKLLHPPEDEINPKLLISLHRKGQQGIKKAGGLSKIARVENIPISALRQFIRKDGSLTRKGKLLLDVKINPKATLPWDTLKSEHAGNHAARQAISSATSQQHEEAQHLVTQQKDTSSGAQKSGRTDISDAIPSTSREHSELALENASHDAQADHDIAPRPLISPNKEILSLVRKRRDWFESISLSAPIEGHSWDLLYNLEKNVFYMGYRDYLGEWQRASDTPYIAQHGDEAIMAPVTIENRIVTNEQRTETLKALGCNLDLNNVEKWTSRYHKHKEIPKLISSIWVGNKEIPKHLLATLQNNADLALSSLNFYAFTLYLSRRDEGAYIRNCELLATHAPFVQIAALEETPFFEKFAQSKYYEQYNAAIEGNGGVATNFASAADVLRFQLLHDVGGIYMDVDDKLLVSPGDVRLIAPPDGFVLSSPMSNEQLGMFDQYPTSIFGTQKNNPTLKKVSDEIYKRYQENKDIYQFRPSLDDTVRFAVYSQRISYLTGPGVFDTIIQESRYEESQVLEAHRLWRLPLDDKFAELMQTSWVKTIFKLLVCDVIRLSDIVEVGGENSWQYNR